MSESHQSRFRPGIFQWISQVVVEKRSLLLGVARKEGLEAQGALDVVQDALVTLFEIPQGRALAEDPEDLARFLVVIVKNAARNKRRRHYLRKEHDADPDTLGRLISDSDSVEDLVVQAEQHVALLGCIKKLKELQFQVVQLRLLEDRGGDEVAKILDVTTDHVAVLLHRAKRSIKECMLN